MNLFLYFGDFSDFVFEEKSPKRPNNYIILFSAKSVFSSEVHFINNIQQQGFHQYLRINVKAYYAHLVCVLSRSQKQVYVVSTTGKYSKLLLTQNLMET